MISASQYRSSRNWPEDRSPFKTRISLCSFVQEFIGDPLDGVTLLLDLLRAVQLSQANQQTRCPPPVLRRALLDENSCLQCLRSCLRCPDAARRLSASPAGLFTLAVCIMSNVSKSRVLALEVSHVTCTSCHRHNWYVVQLNKQFATCREKRKSAHSMTPSTNLTLTELCNVDCTTCSGLPSPSTVHSGTAVQYQMHEQI